MKPTHLPRELVCALALAAASPSAARAGSAHEDTAATTPTRVHDEPTFMFEDGCAYAAVVSGWLLPGQAEPDGPVRVHARLDVTASVMCPNRPVVRSSEVLDANLARTIDQVEKWIERAATIEFARSNRACLYVPELSVNERGLRIDQVARMCPTARGKRIDGTKTTRGPQ